MNGPNIRAGINRRQMLQRSGAGFGSLLDAKQLFAHHREITEFHEQEPDDGERVAPVVAGADAGDESRSVFPDRFEHPYPR